ncbi:hypothetical protein IAQ61_000290 [Plenodomus lingam]|uniref:uncharacterized protein n=1 Tax=Leptosphaeria maculans TaxID=5022 RepID=UPI0033346B36|nr:hypothetical protein IAQ61_000290 [Plenodomus lingam]
MLCIKYPTCSHFPFPFAAFFQLMKCTGATGNICPVLSGDGPTGGCFLFAVLVAALMLLVVCAGAMGNVCPVLGGCGPFDGGCGWGGWCFLVVGVGLGVILGLGLGLGLMLIFVLVLPHVLEIWVLGFEGCGIDHGVGKRDGGRWVGVRKSITSKNSKQYPSHQHPHHPPPRNS